MSNKKQGTKQLNSALIEGQKIISDNGEIESIRNKNPWEDAAFFKQLKYNSKSYSISNEIVFSVQPMTVTETKLLRIILASTTENIFKNDAFVPFKMHVSQIAKLLGISPNRHSAYESIYDAAWSLSKRQLFIETEDSWEAHNWFDYISFEKKGRGGIIMQLSSSLKKYLIDLQKNFSVFSIPLLLSFKKKYSIHLYEGLTSKIRRDKKLSKKYRNEEITIVSFSTNELRKLTTTLNNYSNISDLKRYVIEPSIKEINDLSDFIILKYEAVRIADVKTNLFNFFIKKRVIIPTTVNFNNASQTKYPNIETWSEDYIKNIFELNNCRYSEENISYLVEKYDEDTFLEDFRIAKTKAKSDITNYMVSMIENKPDTFELTDKEEKLFDEIFNYWNDSCIEHEAKKEAHVKPVKYKTKFAKKRFKTLLDEGITINEIKNNIENANNSEFFLDNEHTFSYFLVPENFKRVANEDEKYDSISY